MTPNPNSPIFIKHEVPDMACESSKALSNIYFQLKEEIDNGKWQGVKSDDLSLSYNFYNGCTEVKLAYTDSNSHIHQFIMQLMPDNGFGDGEDSFRLLYLFEGQLDEKTPFVRSFADYLSIHLQFEGFEPILINNGNGLSISCVLQYAYSAYCDLIDKTLSLLKPLSWYYAPESSIKGIDEAYYYMNSICALLQIQSCKGRWKGVTPDSFKVARYNGEVACELSFQVKDVWELCLFATIADSKDYYDMCCSFYCYPNDELSDNIKEQLHSLFGEFLSTLKCAKGNIYVGGGMIEDHFVHLQYFYIDDTFDVFCSMLDEIVPKVQSYKFHIPDQQAELTEEMVAVKIQMEKALSTRLHVVTEIEEINNKLKHGYFKD